jgi:hypothetical protein
MFCSVLLCSIRFCTILFRSVLLCHFLSRVASCCTDSYRIVSAFYCSVLYAILRNAPLWCVCYTAQCTLHSFLRLLCFEALPYCSVLVYQLKYNTIHQIYHAPWCVRIPSIFLSVVRHHYVHFLFTSVTSKWRYEVCRHAW